MRQLSVEQEFVVVDVWKRCYVRDEHEDSEIAYFANIARKGLERQRS